MSGSARKSHRRLAMAALPALTVFAIVGWLTSSPQAIAQGIPPTAPIVPAAPLAGPAPQAISVIGRCDDPRFEFNLHQGDRRIVAGPWPAGAPSTRASTVYSPQGNLQLSIDVSAIDGVGYFPLVLEVSQPTAATSRRNVEVRFHAGSYGDGGQAMAVDALLVIAKGKSSAKARVLIPKYQEWQFWGWETRVDGLRDPALCVDRAGWTWQIQPGGATVWIHPSAQGFEDQLKPAVERLTGGQQIPEFKRVDPAALPVDWLEYTSADLVVMRADDLTGLVEKHPARADGLLRWIRAGGSLWLLQAGTQWEGLGEIDRALARNDAAPREHETTVVAGDPENRASDPFARAWRKPSVGATAIEAVSGALLLSPMSVDEVEATRPRPTDAAAAIATVGGTRDSSGNLLPKEASQWYAVRGHGYGLIAAFRVPAGPGRLLSRLETDVLDQTVMKPRLNWVERHGNHPHEVNLQFNNWLIPGVGVAPVGQFQVLLTLFALAIGPLNYWLLVRRGKLPMLLATIPAAALATTVLLFAYGLFADGMGVRVRARSLTLLDQPAGESATWSRHSYYAGFAPREGIAARPGTAVFPVLPQWAPEFASGGALMRVSRWNDDREQHLGSGWLTSRTPTQYLTTSARASDKRLEIRAAEGGLRVANRLGVGVRQLLIQRNMGETYWCENLEVGATALAPATDMAAISIKLRREFSDHFPEYPAGGDPNSLGVSSYYTTVLSKNLLEANLDALNSPSIESWGDRTYLAVTDSSFAADLAVEDAIEEDSFHVIRGSW